MRYTPLIILASALLMNDRHLVLSASAAAPDFGPNVLVFDPGMTNIQSRIDAVFKKQERNQFGPDRFAYLFKPGKYDLDVQVGFYMQVLGLDARPMTSPSRARSGPRRNG